MQTLFATGFRPSSGFLGADPAPSPSPSPSPSPAPQPIIIQQPPVYYPYQYPVYPVTTPTPEPAPSYAIPPSAYIIGGAVLLAGIIAVVASR